VLILSAVEIVLRKKNTNLAKGTLLKYKTTMLYLTVQSRCGFGCRKGTKCVSMRANKRQPSVSNLNLFALDIINTRTIREVVFKSQKLCRLSQNCVSPTLIPTSYLRQHTRYVQSISPLKIIIVHCRVSHYDAFSPPAPVTYGDQFPI
jgi:hypothetical protein